LIKEGEGGIPTRRRKARTNSAGWPAIRLGIESAAHGIKVLEFYRFTSPLCEGILYIKVQASYNC
jgi:hypothetical protein